MSGIQMALLGAGSTGPIVIVGQYFYTYGPPVNLTLFYYGYNTSTASPLADFGTIDNGIFKGVTIKSIFSTGISSGQAISYTVYFDGDQTSPAGFVNTLTVNGTLVGSFGAGSYNAGRNETSFTITLASAAATLFGTTNGVRIPTILT